MSKSDGVVLFIHNYTPADPSRSYHVTVSLPRTVNQIIRKSPVKERRRRKVGPMSGRPQLKGVVLQVMIRKPKKLNSAQRKCCRVRLSTGKEVIAHTPGEGHTFRAVFRGKNDWGGGANTDRVAKGHGEGEGAGGGCAPSCVESEAPFHKVNGKLKRDPLIICTCSCCVGLSMEKFFPPLQVRGGGGGGGGVISPPCPPPKYGPDIAGTQCGIGSRGTDAGFSRGQCPSDTGEIRLYRSEGTHTNLFVFFFVV